MCDYLRRDAALKLSDLSRFNKRRDDVDDLREYNDYLQEVEDIGACLHIDLALYLPNIISAFNLINNIDVQETEAKIANYKAANAALIALNMQREEAYALALKEQEDLDRREREARAAQLAQEEEQERLEREREQNELITKLETSQKDAKKLVAKARASQQKRKSARTDNSSLLGGMGFGADYAKLLKARTNKAKTSVPDEPHVPLQDDWYGYEDFYVLRPSYDDIFSEAVRKDREGIMRAGGYMVEEAWNRALRSAVAGLELEPLVGLPSEESSAPMIDAGGDVVMASVYSAA